MLARLLPVPHKIICNLMQRVTELEAQQSITGAAESKLQIALAELDELKATRERQMDIMRDYISKRDSYPFHILYCTNHPINICL